MEPFVALMKKYCIDYTNSHDQSVCDEIMHPDYVVHISGWIFRGTRHTSRLRGGCSIVFRGLGSMFMSS